MEQVKQLKFSDDKFNIIVKNTVELAAASTSKNFGAYGIIEDVQMDSDKYKELNSKVKESTLCYAAEKAGIPVPQDATEMAFALDNTMFKTVLNSIIARSIGEMMVTYRAPQLDRLAQIDTVPAGSSMSYEIETKALPIAQKATYGSNVTMVPSYAKSSITVTPKPYSIGLSLDFIRILANGYDWGYAIARVYAGMLFAQYKLIVSQLFSTSVLTGTPLYQANFSSAGYTQLASDVAMLAGVGIENVTAYGSLVAWNALSALATQGGFTTKDDYIRNAYLQKIYGVDSMILSDFTNFAAPFTTGNAAGLRSVPNNLIVLVPANDKPVKVVREAYIRVVETPAQDNTLNRNEYSYFQSFDAALATPNYFGLQGTTAAA